MRIEDKRIDEYRYDCEIPIRETIKIKFKKEYPKKLSKENFDDLYFDQSPYHAKYGERVFSSVYLRTGLKRMESFFIREITNRETSIYTKLELEKMIKYNLHLHNIIKTNLLENLNNKWLD